MTSTISTNIYKSSYFKFAKEIRKISGKKLASQEQVYGVGHKALNRTPIFFACGRRS